MGQGTGDVENQRNEDSEGLFLSCTFGGSVQISLMHAWGVEMTGKFDLH